MCRLGDVNAVTAGPDKLMASIAAASAYRFFETVSRDFDVV
jgi:hypothetical protein